MQNVGRRPLALAFDSQLGRRGADLSLVQRLFVEAGHAALTAGRFADGPAVELLQAARELDPPMLWGELEAWRRLRTPEVAALGLAEAIPALDAAAQILAFAALADIPRT